MNKEQFNAWLQRKVERQVRLTVSASAAMALLGVLVMIVQGGLLYAAFSFAYNSSFLGAMIVLAFYGITSAFIWRTAPTRLADASHDFDTISGTRSVQTAPTLSSAWTFAMGSRDSDQSIPQRIISFMLLVPRLFWTAFYVFERIDQVRQIDVATCGKIIRLALKRAERVEATEIADAFPDIPLQPTMRQLSLIDGVVFLTNESVGLSIANRFKDDLEAASAKVDSTSANKSSPFDS